MRKKTLFLLVTLVIFPLLSQSVQQVDNEHVIVGEYRDSELITLVFAGDIMSHFPQVKAAYIQQGDSFDYRPCFQYLKPYIATADLAVVNLEVPLAGKPYSGYPQFSAPEQLADGATDAGFDVLLTANNHTVDRGGKGIERTIQQLDKRSLHTGAFRSQAERDSLYPLITEVKGMKIAVLNCTYDTNGIPVPKPFVVNMIDTAQIRRDVAKARERAAEFVIMCIHWGIEYQTEANATQQELAGFLARAGVDLIIGSHPHVVQNFSVVYRPDSTQVPVFYSLGNMISNQSKRGTNGGILAKVVIDKNTCNIQYCNYLPFFVYKGNLQERYQYYLIPTVDYIARPQDFGIGNTADLLLRQFQDDTQARLSNLPMTLDKFTRTDD